MGIWIPAPILPDDPALQGRTDPPPLPPPPPELAVSSSCPLSTPLVQREMGTAEDEMLGCPLSTSPKEGGDDRGLDGGMASPARWM